MNPILKKHWPKLAGVIVVALLCLASFSFGRAMVPPAEVKIVEKVVTVEVEKLVEKLVEKKVLVADTSQKVRRVERVIERPDGTKETVRTEDVDSDTSTKVVEDKATERVVEKIMTIEKEKLVEVSKPAPDWRVAPLVGVNIPELPSLLTGPYDPLRHTTFGVAVERRILGPVALSAFGLTSGQVGLGVSFEF